MIFEGKLVGKYTFRPMDASWDMMKYPSFENHKETSRGLTPATKTPGRDTQGGERTESNPTKPGFFLGKRKRQKLTSPVPPWK